jgi:hypothetical protein
MTCVDTTLTHPCHFFVCVALCVNSGCPNTSPPDICGLCPDGYRLTDASLVVDTNDVTCGEVDESIRHFPTLEICEANRADLDAPRGLAEFCCERTPLTGCALCGSSDSTATFDATIVVPGRLYVSEDPLTCGDLESLDVASLTDPLFGGDITSCLATLLEKSSAWCQCSNAAPSCTLCADGSSPPDLTLTEDLFFGLDCATFEYAATFLSRDECTNLAGEDYLSFDAAAFCKCPGTTAPNFCQVCPTGMTFRNPDSFLPDDDSGLTCGHLQTSFSFVSTKEMCTNYRTGLHAFEEVVRLCCEGEATTDTTPSNTTTDGGAPGTTSTSAAAAATPFGTWFSTTVMAMMWMTTLVSALLGWA